MSYRIGGIVNRLSLLVCAVCLVAGCQAPSKIGHVDYLMFGTSNSVKVLSMWKGNQELHFANPYVKLPWHHDFDGVPDLHLGLTAGKWDTGSLHVHVSVNHKLMADDSVPRADIGGTVEVELWWP